MRGRKPLPTSRRVLEGNRGKRPINKQEPDPPIAPAFDTPPRELNGNKGAREEWRRLAPMLRLRKQITDADRSALLALCVEWARYLEASRHVLTEGMVVATPQGFQAQNAYLPIANKALASCARLWPELGLTPSSRSRVKTETPGGSLDPFDEFDAPVPAPGGRVQ